MGNGAGIEGGGGQGFSMCHFIQFYVELVLDHIVVFDRSEENKAIDDR